MWGSNRMNGWKFKGVEASAREGRTERGQKGEEKRKERQKKNTRVNENGKGK